MTLAVTWQKGGGASVRSLTGEMVVVGSTISSAPGSTLEGDLGGGARLRLKVKTCRREEDGVFRIEGRAVDLRREDRAALEAILASASLPS